MVFKTIPIDYGFCYYRTFCNKLKFKQNEKFSNLTKDTCTLLNQVYFVDWI